MNSDEQTDAPLISDQTTIHPDLDSVVGRHLNSAWRKPIPDHTLTACDQLCDWLAARGKPLLLDAYCGTGMSTAALARLHPDCAVVGVDKSAARLGRHQQQGDYLLLRAECEPLWKALVERGIHARQQTLLYPNPWPKSAQLKRRIHGHPGLPWLLKLGGQIELRSNWAIYVHEFARAMALAGCQGEITRFVPEHHLTLFERKYHERGQTLWRWRGQAPGMTPDGAPASAGLP